MPSGDDTTTTPNGSRRELRARRRRSGRRRLLPGVAVALLVTGGAYAVTGPLRPGDDRAASSSDRTTPSEGAIPASERACRAPLDARDPLRLWIGGDSLAGSLGVSLGEATGKSGVVQPVVDSRVSSGLLSPGFFDWPKNGVEDMRTYEPEVAVFVIGANDAKNLPRGAERSTQWRAEYAAAVEEMLEVLAGDGRTVYWVGAPVMSDAAYSERVETVNSVFQDIAARRPEMIYVDAFSALSGPDGKFAVTLTDGDGKAVRVRAHDGIHLTPEGGDVLARTVLEQLDPQCRIGQQAVEGVVKPIVEVRGSDPAPARSAPPAGGRR